MWVDRVALNNEVFVDTSTELIQDDEIRTAIATRAVDELFLSVDVQAELEQQLPDDYQRLSGPATAALREGSYRLVERALKQPRLQRLWALTIDESHRTLIGVLEGGGDTVSTEEGAVTLDLELIVLEAADRIGLRDQIAGEIPEDVGRIEILRSDELEAAQDGLNVLETLAWVLPVLALAAFALAVWIAGDRRRAVRRVGITVAVVGLVGLAAVGVGGNYVVDSLVAETENRAAAGNAWDIFTELLRRSFWWFVAVGVLFLVAAWLAGPRSSSRCLSPCRRAGRSPARLGVRGARDPLRDPAPHRPCGRLRPLPRRHHSRRARRRLDRGDACTDPARAPERLRARALRGDPVSACGMVGDPAARRSRDRGPHRSSAALSRPGSRSSPICMHAAS